MFVNRLVTRSTGVLSKIYTHPFNQQLCAGTLPSETFKFYLEQDALYLRDFSKVLKLIANRFTERHYAEQFKQLSNDMIAYELNIHSRYLRRAEPKTFFSPKNHLPLQKISAIVNYTEHLFDMANKAPIAAAVASCVPCFLTYNELGTQMNTRCAPNNPYHDWIASYSRPKFTRSTHSIIETMNELAGTVSCPTLNEDVSSSFLQSAKFELKFFDDAHAGKASYTATEQCMEHK